MSRYEFDDLEAAVLDAYDWIEYSYNVAYELDRDCEGEFKELAEYMEKLYEAKQAFPKDLPQKLQEAAKQMREYRDHMADLADGASY